MKFTYFISGIEEAAHKILDLAKTRTLLFSGEMGAGKTTLIKELVKKLGSKNPVSSPTFALVNEYETPEGPVFHFDFYRIENEEEALDIGFEEYLYSENWKLIEWPEKVANLLPKEVTHIHIKSLPDGNREITMGK